MIMTRIGRDERPLYAPEFAPYINLAEVEDGVPWIDRTEARREAFMTFTPIRYTYGGGRGARTYESTPYTPIVRGILAMVNGRLGALDVRMVTDGTELNGVFLNRYAHDRHQLGWHADDSPGQDFDSPIAVVSFGEAREIWWRRNGETGVVPPAQRLRLAHGSLFVMPPGFQATHQHRIPKGDRPMGPRVSLTMRRFVPVGR